MIQRRVLSPEKALIRLEELCARSEQCTGEVREKLRRWGISSSDADKIVKHLVDNRYVDDRRFARAYVRDKFMFSHWGRRKISIQLTAKRVARDIVVSAIEDTIDEEEYFSALVRLLCVRGARLGGADEDGVKHPEIETYEGRTRLYRFALGRGFESDIISKAIRHLVAGDSY